MVRYFGAGSGSVSAPKSAHPVPESVRRVSRQLRGAAQVLDPPEERAAYLRLPIEVVVYVHYQDEEPLALVGAEPCLWHIIKIENKDI